MTLIKLRELHRRARPGTAAVWAWDSQASISLTVLTIFLMSQENSNALGHVKGEQVRAYRLPDSGFYGKN